VRYCPDCGARLTRTTTRGGLPRDVCPECDDDGTSYGGNFECVPSADHACPDCDGRLRPQVPRLLYVCRRCSRRVVEVARRTPVAPAGGDTR
jgi:predicted nucleic acid-binding Zn ribbon protein